MGPANKLGQSDASDKKATGESRPRRRLYRPPALRCYGDIRDVTLGGTSGNIESGGGPVTFRT